MHCYKSPISYTSYEHYELLTPQHWVQGMYHLHKTFKICDKDLCPCGSAKQTTSHNLQSCLIYNDFRDRVWPDPIVETQKLYGCQEDVQSLPNSRKNQIAHLTNENKKKIYHQRVNTSGDLHIDFQLSLFLLIKKKIL